jgi:hypothetical protein
VGEKQKSAGLGNNRVAEYFYKSPIITGVCVCCRDPACRFIGIKKYCEECYEELMYGIISHEPAKLGFGRGG